MSNHMTERPFKFYSDVTLEVMLMELEGWIEGTVSRAPLAEHMLAQAHTLSVAIIDEQRVREDASA